MRYHALACDYDGTLVRHGSVELETVEALLALRESGRRLVLVTGRELPDLARVFPRLDLFDRVVAENGALIYRPASREERLLADPPPAGFLERLAAKGVGPISVGRSIVATVQPHEAAVLAAIRELGLELQVIFNKGAVMVLPSGVNKATGLEAALGELGLSPHNVAGVGDGENDHAFLDFVECPVAVANAVPALKEKADWVTAGEDGTGVRELVRRMIDEDLGSVERRDGRDLIVLGNGEGGEPAGVRVYGESVLIAGTSGSGKSTLATQFLETLAERKYQFLIVDPEGDYEGLEVAVMLGDGRRVPTLDEVAQLLEKPDRNVCVGLLAVPMEQRPVMFQGLMTLVSDLRAKYGRPHWVLLDEIHHLMPAGPPARPETLPSDAKRFAMITVHPEHVAPAARAAADVVVAVGKAPCETLREFAKGTGAVAPSVAEEDLEPGQVWLWRPASEAPPVRLKARPSTTQRRRHRRKYADAELPPEKSFFFRGPEAKLNLRAQNLKVFLQLAEGVDAETWLHHLRRGDYSKWFREMIKDEGLAEDAETVERNGGDAAESRSKVRAAIEERYTEPA